jgi:exo-beta-1,3-glucanase (GH17 family)
VSVEISLKEKYITFLNNTAILKKVDNMENNDQPFYKDKKPNFLKEVLQWILVSIAGLCGCNSNTCVCI